MSDGDKTLEQNEAGEGDKEFWVWLERSGFGNINKVVSLGLVFRQRF